MSEQKAKYDVGGESLTLLQERIAAFYDTHQLPFRALDDLTALIAFAVEQERETCAELALSTGYSLHETDDRVLRDCSDVTGEKIAAAIRARTTTTSTASSLVDAVADHLRQALPDVPIMTEQPSNGMGDFDALMQRSGRLAGLALGDTVTDRDFPVTSDRPYIEVLVSLHPQIIFGFDRMADGWRRVK